jgi:hypothetical protein
MQLAPEQSKLRLLHVTVVFDMLVVHEADILAKGSIQVCKYSKLDRQEVPNYRDLITDFWFFYWTGRSRLSRYKVVLVSDLQKLVLSWLIDNTGEREWKFL